MLARDGAGKIILARDGAGKHRHQQLMISHDILCPCHNVCVEWFRGRGMSALAFG
jgi:hypothetical protein